MEEGFNPCFTFTTSAIGCCWYPLLASDVRDDKLLCQALRFRGCLGVPFRGTFIRAVQVPKVKNVRKGLEMVLGHVAIAKSMVSIPLHAVLCQVLALRLVLPRGTKIAHSLFFVCALCEDAAALVTVDTCGLPA